MNDEAARLWQADTSLVNCTKTPHIFLTHSGTQNPSPGPICYGKGGQQWTVTDANVFLGRLPPRFFLGGSVPLAVDRIVPAAETMPWTRRWKSLQAIAQGVIDVVNANMEQAIRLISVERGYDPRDFTLVCFGGAGGLHAADIGRALAIPRVLIPPYPGALSALGLLLSDVRKDYSRSMLIPAAGCEKQARQELDALHRIGRQELKAEGFEGSAVRISDFLDLRYRGQSYDLTVPFTLDFIKRFHRLHEQRYGHSDKTRELELVNVRTVLIGKSPSVRFPKVKRAKGRPRPVEVSRAWFAGKLCKTAIFDRADLRCGHRIEGPAIIGEYSATTLVPPDFICEVDGFGNLVLEVSR